MRPLSNIQSFVNRLSHPKLLGREITCRKILPAHPASRSDYEIVSSLKSALKIPSLFSHQAEALSKIKEGKNVVVATPAASGKSLIYNYAILEALKTDPDLTALYIFPIKALAQDQMGKLREIIRLSGINARAEIYDGDTPSSKRSQIRSSPPQFIFTNPDMLHFAFLPYHTEWAHFLKKLRYIVLDEVHSYKGVFGAHVHHTIQRLRRILKKLGSRAQWVASSATAGNPLDFAKNLVGEPFDAILKSGASQSERHLLFVNPSASPYTTAVKIFGECLNAGYKTIVFTKARKATELIYAWFKEQNPDLAEKVRAYRAGFLPKERREIEKSFFDGSLAGVVSTSAMEMGIDIGGLDACILVGYPGSIISFHQRSGRAGRSEDSPALVILIALPDALDQYIMHHPEHIFESPLEPLILDPQNPYILTKHFSCAASEEPIANDELSIYPYDVSPFVKKMEQKGALLLNREGTHWHSRERAPHRKVNLRTAGEGFRIVEAGTGKIIGTTDSTRVFQECHPGAIYLHQGRMLSVRSLDAALKKVFAEESDEDFYTQPRVSKETEILKTSASFSRPHYECHFGDLKVTETVYGYVKKHLFNQTFLGEHPLELPPLTFETKGFWFSISPAVAEAVAEARSHLMGGLHATEHAVLALFPLLAICDRWDLGGISYVSHPQTLAPSVFIYDGYPGGIGIARRGYELFDTLSQKTLQLLSECECEEGCPACIHSPKCGSGNKPLDKTAALTILKGLCGEYDHKKSGRIRKTQSSPSVVKERPKKRKNIVFDIETKFLAEDVGGWEFSHKLGLALAVAYYPEEDKYQTFFEKDARELAETLLSAERVIGFNHINFDYKVLSAYTDEDFLKISNLDLLLDIKERLGRRISLNDLARVTLGRGKTADGLQSVRWFKEGKLDLVEKYCKEDVRLTYDLWRYGAENGFVCFEEKRGWVLRVKVDWK